MTFVKLMTIDIKLWMVLVVIALISGSAMYKVHDANTKLDEYKLLYDDASKKLGECELDLSTTTGNYNTISTALDTYSKQTQQRAEEYKLQIAERDQRIADLTKKVGVSNKKASDLAAAFKSTNSNSEESIKWLAEVSSQLYW